jgi:hypothetical protein
MNINWKRLLRGPLLVVILFSTKKFIDFIYPIGENNFIVAAIVLGIAYFIYIKKFRKQEKLELDDYIRKELLNHEEFENQTIKDLDFLCGFDNSEEAYEETIKLIKENRIAELKEKSDYNIKNDNLFIYRVTTGSNCEYIATVLDLFEYTANPTIMDVHLSNEHNE